MLYRKLHVSLLTTSLMFTTLSAADIRTVANNPASESASHVSFGSMPIGRQSAPSMGGTSAGTFATFSGLNPADVYRTEPWNTSISKLATAHLTLEQSAQQALTKLAAISKQSPSPVDNNLVQPATTRASIFPPKTRATKATYDTLVDSYETWLTYCENLRTLSTDAARELRKQKAEEAKKTAERQLQADQQKHDAEAAHLPLDADSSVAKIQADQQKYYAQAAHLPLDAYRFVVQKLSTICYWFGTTCKRRWGTSTLPKNR